MSPNVPPEHDAPPENEDEKLRLVKAAQLLNAECRMILPGIQTLFGFQLIAVFNEQFQNLLTSNEKRLHLLAMALTAIGVALVMSPAAYHRRVGYRHVTERFLRTSTRLVVCSMPLLAASLCAELYLASRVIASGVWATVLASVLFAVFIGLWFVLPRWLTDEKRGES
jgi:hypothetical protein